MKRLLWLAVAALLVWAPLVACDPTWPTSPAPTTGSVPAAPTTVPSAVVIRP
ncbi:hypothetical protein [Lentzea sp. NBRC 105346]|uniref:hypothetical protein n=1 Tax=Lentzea sp. NBRC 105346 TaxID=3032205 RepID=UPI002555FED4|nr:hypothetical protein [Lentzea sp. NBRC 105346]